MAIIYFESLMRFYKRFIRLELEDELFYNSALYLSGPRNVGKKTLCKECNIKYSFVDFQNKGLAKIAKKNPSQFIKALPPGIKLMQHSYFVPEIYNFIKRAIHRIAKRSLYDVPPQFLILDEAHPILETKQRLDAINAAAIVELYPLSAAEALLDGNIQFIHSIYNNLFEKKKLISKKNLVGGALAATFPEIVEWNYDKRRKYYQEFLSYVFDTLVRKRFHLDRGVKLQKFFKYLSKKVGQKLDWREISKHLSLESALCKYDLEVLKQLYLILTIAPWKGDKKKTEAHIVYFIDTGFLFHILDESNISHPQNSKLLLEQFVAIEMIKHTQCLREYELYHLKGEDDLNLEFIIEDKRNGKVIGIKLLSSEQVEDSDFKDLEDFKKFAGENFSKAVILYLGNEILFKNKDFLALPIQTIWGED
jgi:hypothetical protein